MRNSGEILRMAKTKMRREYFLWLCGLVNGVDGGENFCELLRALHDKEFIWSVPNDDNRAVEGRNLRERFCDEIRGVYIFDNFPEEVTLLEVLIALAYRCESQVEDTTMLEWFWKMVSNIGLSEITDDVFYNMGVPDYVDETLNNILYRRYHRNGRGGLFPLKRSKKDQRKVELWYQMNEYLVENFFNDTDVV